MFTCHVTEDGNEETHRIPSSSYHQSLALSDYGAGIFTVREIYSKEKHSSGCERVLLLLATRAQPVSLIPEKIRTAPQTREMTVMRWVPRSKIATCVHPTLTTCTPPSLPPPTLSPALSGQRAFSPASPDTTYRVFGPQSISHSHRVAEQSMYAL